MYLIEGVHDHGIFKAVFLAGAPGSGKDFVLKKALDGHGFTEINSDKAHEHLMDKHKLDKKMPEHQQEKNGKLADRAKSLTDLRQRLAIHGRNGLIINSTGSNLEQVKKIKGMLEDLGYDSKMVFVDASDNVSRNRNVERGQRGGRMIPEKQRAEKWRQAQDARVHYSKMFGGEHYHEFNNDEDLRHNSDSEVHGQKTKELEDLHKTVRKFSQQPPKSPVAAAWIHSNLGKLAKQPIGNKKQQASQTPPAQNSQAAQDAQKLGLQYYGYGRYGKNARVTHFSLHGKLVEKQKALKPLAVAKTPQAPKKLNEAFEDLLSEDRPDHLDYPSLVSEEARPVSFQSLRERLVGKYRPEEGESLTEVPLYAQDLGSTQDGDPEGSITGMGQGKEQIDMKNGGKASSGPGVEGLKNLPKKIKPRGEGY